MATIGLDKLFYAPITEGENGDEEYGTPVMLAKAMTAELSIELNEATLYADDGAAEIVKEFKSGTLSLGVDDIGSRLPRPQGKRHLPIFLALPGEICGAFHQPDDQRRFYRVFHPDD